MSLSKDNFHVTFETDETLDPELYDTAHFVIGALLAVRKGVFAEAIVTLRCLDGSSVQIRYPDAETAVVEDDLNGEAMVNEGGRP